jgi:hypothetical protein
VAEFIAVDEDNGSSLTKGGGPDGGLGLLGFTLPAPVETPFTFALVELAVVAEGGLVLWEAVVMELLNGIIEVCLGFISKLLST